jgi:hypothetical protein
MSAPEPPAFRAWVDESGSDRAQDPGTYILAAVVLETILEDDVRKTMRSMRLPGQEKLHWRDEDARRRRKIATTVATVPAHNFVVVRSTPLVLPHDPERARRKCFERLIWELAQMGVDEAVFESRGKADDRRVSRKSQWNAAGTGDHGSRGLVSAWNQGSTSARGL